MTESRLEGAAPPSWARRLGYGGSGAPNWLIGLVAGLIFAIWRHGVLSQLPVWDGAMGVSPAAITLERLDFDVWTLLEMDDYRSGGPNLHALSGYVWFVAVMIRVCGSYASALPMLHVASFVLLAVLAAGVHRTARSAGITESGALMATVLAVLFPPMVVQASDVYVDLPLAAASTWSMAFALENRWTSSVAMACIGAALKPSAVILLPVLAVLMVDHPSFRWRRIGALTLPAAIAVAPLLLDGAMRSASSGPEVTVTGTTAYTLFYLSRMPLLLALILVVAVFHFVGRRECEDRGLRRLSAAALLLVLSFLLFFFLNPLASKGVPALPRYTTMFTPMLAAALVAGAERCLSGHSRTVPAAVFLLLFITNMGGRLEPSSLNLYPLAERSLAYEKMLSVQSAALARFVELGQSMPTYYDHFTHYRLSYPETGWSEGSLEDGTPVHIAQDRTWRDLENLPDEFALLIEAEWLGGQELAAIERRVRSSGAWSVESEVIRQGEFTNRVVVARRTD